MIRILRKPWLILRRYKEAFKVGGILASVVIGIYLIATTRAIVDQTAHKVDQIVDEYSPLRFDQTQNVVREPPVFHLGDPVAVEADFKNTDSVPVQFSGAVHWRLISPDHNIEVFQFEFNGDVEPGCKLFRFDNLPPPGVVETTNRLFSEGYDSVTWELFGDNVVTRPRPGAAVAFHVEQFRYIPNDRPLPQFQDVHDNTDCKNL